GGWLRPGAGLAALPAVLRSHHGESHRPCRGHTASDALAADAAPAAALLRRSGLYFDLGRGSRRGARRTRLRARDAGAELPRYAAADAPPRRPLPLPLPQDGASSRGGAEPAGNTRRRRFPVTVRVGQVARAFHPTGLRRRSKIGR